MLPSNSVLFVSALLAQRKRPTGAEPPSASPRTPWKNDRLVTLRHRFCGQLGLVLAATEPDAGRGRAERSALRACIADPPCVMLVRHSAEFATVNYNVDMMRLCPSVFPTAPTLRLPLQMLSRILLIASACLACATMVRPAPTSRRARAHFEDVRTPGGRLVVEPSAEPLWRRWLPAADRARPSPLLLLRRPSRAPLPDADRRRGPPQLEGGSRAAPRGGAHPLDRRLRTAATRRAEPAPAPRCLGQPRALQLRFGRAGLPLGSQPGRAASQLQLWQHLAAVMSALRGVLHPEMVFGCE